MKERKTPQEKKALDYKKTHLNMAEYPHAFRRHWPRTEARTNRKYRRQIAQLLDQIEYTTLNDESEELNAQALPIRRDEVRKKSGVISLHDRVSGTLEYRVSRTGWNYFKKPYDSSLHHEPFIGLLTALTSGKNDHARELALLFNEFLDPPEITDYPKPEAWKAESSIRSWLKAFFVDEPEWEPLLRTWIINITAQKAE